MWNVGQEKMFPLRNFWCYFISQAQTSTARYSYCENIAPTHYYQRHLERVHSWWFLHFALVSTAVSKWQQGDHQRGVTHRGVASSKAESISKHATAMDVFGATSVRQELMKWGQMETGCYNTSLLSVVPLHHCLLPEPLARWNMVQSTLIRSTWTPK